MDYTKVLTDLKRTKEALAKKLDAIKSDVTNVNNSVTNLPTTLDTKFSALTTKVDGVKTDVAGVGTKVDSVGSTLGGKIDTAQTSISNKVDDLNKYSLLTNIGYRFPQQLNIELEKKFNKQGLAVNKVIPFSEELPPGVIAPQYTTLLDITAPCVFKATTFGIAVTNNGITLPQHKAKVYFKITFREKEKDTVRTFAIKRDSKGFVMPGGSSVNGFSSLTFGLMPKSGVLKDEVYGTDPNGNSRHDYSKTIGLGTSGGVPCVGGYKIEYYLVATDEFRQGTITQSGSTGIFRVNIEHQYILLG